MLALASTGTNIHLHADEKPWLFVPLSTDLLFSALEQCMGSPVTLLIFIEVDLRELRYPFKLSQRTLFFLK